MKASKEAPTHTSTPKQSQQTPPSGQGSQKPRSKSATSAKPPKQQATDDNEADSDTSDSADQEAPEDPIDDFAWRQLEQRFHAIIDEFGDKEVAILQEFRSLVEVRTVSTAQCVGGVLTSQSTSPCGRRSEAEKTPIAASSGESAALRFIKLCPPDACVPD